MARSFNASIRLRPLLLASVFAMGIVPFGSARASSPVPAAEAPFIAESNAAMAKMMAGMAAKPTGDVDRDFVAMMVPHHQGAIDMAEAELRRGRNEQLLRIAQQIIIEQLQEIAAMRIAIGERVPRYEALLAAGVPGIASPVSPAGAKTPAPSLEAEAPFIAENDAAMDRMMTGMAIRPSGDVDHDFVAMMVPHHQGAIDMAEAELRYGHNARLHLIAQEIIVDQIQEIALMRLAVGEPLPPPLSSPTNPSPPPSPPSGPSSGGMTKSPDRMNMKQESLP